MESGKPASTLQRNSSGTTSSIPSAIVILRVRHHVAGERATATAPETTEMTAYEKVIYTLELLDAILVHLPLHRAFLLQKVNRAFYSHIYGSSQIAQALHLAPRRNVEPKLIFPLFNCLQPPVFEYTYINSKPSKCENPVGFIDGAQRQEMYFCISRETARKEITSWG